jgi:hypothetical protein
MVANWLYGVAYTTAHRANVAAAKAREPSIRTIHTEVREIVVRDCYSQQAARFGYVQLTKPRKNRAPARGELTAVLEVFSVRLARREFDTNSLPPQEDFDKLIGR